eukprot:TRINITY_DN8339_c0_g2_i2.p1 TRINITY_DN8339_c0_g2~~TRINITY_DN8339_c0_g2_i2.p1  ORF type:complete len:275 (+),score=25.73 TRINITY_DN8339_c0_g2_i2:322-1146(+)
MINNEDNNASSSDGSALVPWCEFALRFPHIIEIIVSCIDTRTLKHARSINKKVCKFIDRELKQRLSPWDYERFTHYKQHLREDVSVHYLGYDLGVQWENYKRIDSVRILIKAHVHARYSIEDVVRVGIIYTWNHWENVNFMVGPDERYEPPPEFPKYPHDEKNSKRFFDNEARYFFHDKSNCRLFKSSPHEGFFSINLHFGTSLSRYQRPFSNCNHTNYSSNLWFALFVDDKYGNRHFDNNNGWNFEARTWMHSYYNKPPNGFLKQTNHGWQGT